MHSQYYTIKIPKAVIKKLQFHIGNKDGVKKKTWRNTIHVLIKAFCNAKLQVLKCWRMLTANLFFQKFRVHDNFFIKVCNHTSRKPKTEVEPVH